MTGLHAGYLRAAAMAGAALLAGLALATSASAETIGGEQLASPHRTVSLLPGADPLPDVWAETWLIADAQTGEVLAQKGSHVRRAPASTLKMLTALAVLPNTSPTDTWVATRRAATIYGARVGLKPGRTYELDDLWYAVFLPSANDAAIAVAEANGGLRRTVRQMNDVAAELNARDTVARNTSGLDAPGQLSSAYDLALFARAGLARPDFARYAGTARAQFPNVKGRGEHTIYTTNRLLLHGWHGVIGVKTGFTTKAGRTYVGAATRHGRTLIVSLMGIKEASETAAKKLLTWGFANADRVTPVGQLVAAGPLPPPSAEVTAASAPADGGTGGQRAAGASAGAPAARNAASSATWSPLLLAALLLAALVVVATALRLIPRPRGRHAVSARTGTAGSAASGRRGTRAGTSP